MTTLDQDLLKSWNYRMRSDGLSPSTRRNYTQSAERLMRWLAANDLSLDVDAIKRRTLEDFQGWITDPAGANLKASTASATHNGLRQLFRFISDDEDRTLDPLAKVRRPKVPEATVPVFDDGAVAAMLATCGRKTFADIRDAAMLCVLADTGCRRSEVAYITMDALNLDDGTIDVMGKGSKPRTVVIGHQTITAVDRYLRARRTHSHAHLAALWLTQRGALSDSNLYERVKVRASQAGLDHAHTHQFRHSWASNLKAANVQPDELMELAGWTSPAMLARYGRATVKKRALQTGRKTSMVDRLSGR